MTSTHTAQFMAIARIAQHFGRPGTPNDQAWIESFFGHLKGEHPYLDTITDPAVMTRELALRREHYNTIRLHEGIGYVTPDDEHHGRGPRHPKAREHGLKRARANRIATHRQLRHTTHTETPADVVNEIPDWLVISEAPRVGAFEQPALSNGSHAHASARALQAWAQQVTEAYGRALRAAWHVAVGDIGEGWDTLSTLVSFRDRLAAVVRAEVDAALPVTL